jgi:hypothetical protein
MRKLKSMSSAAVDVQDALDEFIERASEFGFAHEWDLVSVNVLPTTSTIPIQKGATSAIPRFDVVIVYWSK